MQQLVMAVADHAEYRQGYMPGEMLLLKLVKFYEQPPEWFVGKDIGWLNELMTLESIRDIAARMGRDPKSVSGDEMGFYRVLEAWRTADTKYHGKVGEDDIPIEHLDEGAE